MLLRLGAIALRMAIRMQAPMKAVTNDPHTPTVVLMKKPRINPPMTAPTMPTMMSPRMPKPPPRITMPASAPAIPPMIIQPIHPSVDVMAATAVSSIVLYPFSLLHQQGLYGPHPHNRQDPCQASWLLAHS